MSRKWLAFDAVAPDSGRARLHHQHEQLVHCVRKDLRGGHLLAVQHIHKDPQRGQTVLGRPMVHLKEVGRAPCTVKFDAC